MEPTPIKQIIDLSTKVAIITGGAMGIGYGIAYRLAESGASVVIVDINKEIGLASVKKLTDKGWKASFIQTDVSDEVQVENAVSFTVSAYGGIDILVNNAGIYPNIPVMKMDTETFKKIMAVNVRSAFLFTKAVSKIMIQQGHGGKIINITSIDAIHPSMVGLAVYDASKHALWGFTKNIALELAPYKIWVNAIAPGGVATPGTGSNNPKMQEIIKPFLAKIPMNRMGESDEIGKVALFLASDLSSYMTGSHVVVDGGVLLS